MPRPVSTRLAAHGPSSSSIKGRLIGGTGGSWRYEASHPDSATIQVPRRALPGNPRRAPYLLLTLTLAVAVLTGASESDNPSEMEVPRGARCAGVSPAARLRWALLRWRRGLILTRLAKTHPPWLRPVHLPNVPLPSEVAETATATLFAWTWPQHAPSEVRVEVVSPQRLSFSFPLGDARPHVAVPPPPPIPQVYCGRIVTDPRAGERAARFRVNGLLWIYAGSPQSPGVAWELTGFDAQGAPQYVLRDTVDYCYRTSCPCGLLRYARPNALALVTACWVCTRLSRLRRRALAQYEHRAARRGRRKPKRQRQTRLGGSNE